MNREDAKQDARLRLRDYADNYLQKSKGGMYCCPICGSGHGAKGTGALGIYADGTKWKCQSCGSGGDVFDLYAAVEGVTLPEAFRGVFSLYGIETDAAQVRPDPLEAFVPAADYTDFYRTAAAALCLTDYHRRRGISDETAKRFMLGYVHNWTPPTKPEAPQTPRLIIPISRSTYLARRTDGGTDYAKQKTGTGSWTFNAQALQTAGRPVFVVEGEIDALSIIEAGGEAVALGSTAYTNMFTQLLDAQRPAQPLIIALDKDPAGISAGDRLEKDMRARGISFYRVFGFLQEKDANDALLKDRAAFTAEIREAEAAALLPEHVRDLRRFLQRVQGDTYKPLPTGTSDIDRALSGGFFRQALILLGGAPGMGKSAFAQWLLENMAQRGACCRYYALEMSKEQMLSRALSRRLFKYAGRDVGAQDVLRGYAWDDDLREAVAQAADAYAQDVADRLQFVEADGALDILLSDMEDAATRAEADGQPAPIVCVDYLQLLQGKDREDDTATLKRATKALKDFAIRHNTAVFAIMAYNREANKRGSADLESGRDTSALEYTADVVLGLQYTAIADGRKNPVTGKTYTREDIQAAYKQARERGDDAPEVCREISLKVLKNRFGEANRSARLLFDGKHSNFWQAETWHMFRDVAQDEEDPEDDLREYRGSRTRRDISKATGLSVAQITDLEAGRYEGLEDEKETLLSFYRGQE